VRCRDGEMRDVVEGLAIIRQRDVAATRSDYSNVRSEIVYSKCPHLRQHPNLIEDYWKREVSLRLDFKDSSVSAVLVRREECA
jgi:hypothetical protein